MAALKATERHGVWRRAGMSGAVTGLDLDEAVKTARALGAADEAGLIHCLMSIEFGAMAGIAKVSDTGGDHG